VSEARCFSGWISGVSTTSELSCRDAPDHVFDEELVTDDNRTEFVKSHFFKDPTDARYYDLVLNTSRWSVPDSAEIIVQALRQLERRLRDADR
jgi:cytidylate kinase